jgi:hypothetical protein
MEDLVLFKDFEFSTVALSVLLKLATMWFLCYIAMVTPWSCDLYLCIYIDKFIIESSETWNALYN